MANLRTKVAANPDIGLLISSGDVNGVSVVHKFGHNGAVGTTFSPVSVGGYYPTPLSSAATTLRIKAGGNANDTAAGSGAREITVVGLDATGAEVTEAIATAGASASSATANSFMRLYRAWVSASGSYATASAGSHSGEIVVEDSAGSADWATISATDFPLGQTEIGAYSVPLRKTAYLTNLAIETESSKAIDVVLFQRENILQASAPFSAMRVFERFKGITGAFNEQFPSPHKFPALTDVGAMAKVATGSAGITIDMEFILVAD